MKLVKYIAGLFIVINALGQQSNTKIYSTKNGLINSTVSYIYQDSKGYTWFATQGGISRFNGKTFFNYTSKNGLPGNDVFFICEDQQHNMWFSISGYGVVKFDGVNFILLTKEQIPSEQVYSIYCDSNGNLWFATIGGGIVKYDGKKYINLTTKDGLPSNDFYCVMEDKEHNMWFGSAKDGLIKYNEKKIKIYTKKEGLTSNSIFCLLKDKENILWIGTAGKGVNKLNGEKIEAVQIPEIEKDFIGSIIKDRHSNIWIASEHGLVKYNEKKYIIYTEKEGLTTNALQALCEDYEGNLWIGTLNAGVCFLKNEAIVTFTDKEGLSNNKINCVIQNAKNNYVIGTNGGGLDLLSDGKITPFKTTAFQNINTLYAAQNGNIWLGLLSDGIIILNENIVSVEVPSVFKKIRRPVMKIIEDKNKNIWIATYGEGVYKTTPTGDIKQYTDSSGLSTNETQTIFEDHNGNIWIATNKAGLIKFDGKNFKLFTKQDGLADNSVWSICEDKKGTLFFGTNEGGISCYDGRKFTTISTEDGLCSDLINALVIDEKNNLWVGTDRGLNKIQLKDSFKINSIKYYGEQDGLKSIEISQNGLYIDHGGLLWIATTNGLTRYNPNYDYVNFTSPKLLLTNIRLSHENVDWAKYNLKIDERTKLPLNLSLPYNNNNLTFDFQALTTDNVKYTYMLEGLDKDWVPLTTSTEAVYPNIQPGDYVFKVKAVNSDGYWSNDIVFYSFTINPPFWKTWWFYISCGLLIVIAVVSFIHTRTSRLEREKKVLEKKVTERTQELQQANNQLSVAYGDIKDSIHYAKKIQDAILPLDSDLKKALPESFILFKPRDVVSGDFYWFNHNNNKIFFAAVDCTGHGVPGAFMSMIGNTLLNEIINEQAEPHPASVLDALNIGVRKSLKQDREVFESKDGMDIALCSIDSASGVLEFSGAKRPLYLIRNGKELLEEIKSDKISIGGMQYEEMQTHFTNHTLQLVKGDTIYIFSDGYADQFGGNKGKKYTTKKLKELVLSLQNYSMQQQKEMLGAEMKKWKGTLEQIDDILVIGVRL